MSTSSSTDAGTDAPERTRLTTLRRVLILLGVFFTAWHIFATFLWIAPSSGLRQVVPGTPCTGIM